MKITIQQEATILGIPVNELSIGQIGECLGNTTGPNKGDLVLRTYNQIVNLNNPKSTWTPADKAHFRVRPLVSGTVLTLTI